MLKLKKTIAVFSAVAALTTGLSGCGSKQTADSETPELTWYFYGSPQKDMQMVNDKFNELVKEKIGCTVKLVMLDANAYDEKMNMVISTKENFDLCWTSPQRNNYYTNISRNAFVPIDELLEEYAPQTKASIKPEFWEAARVNGKIYAVINQQIMGTGYGFFAHRGLVTETGFDWANVKSYTELEPLLAKAKDYAPDKYALSYNKTVEPFVNSLPLFGLEGMGGNDTPGALDSDEAKAGNFKVVNQYETEEFKHYINTMHDWYKKGYLKADAATSSESGTEINNGKYLIIFPQMHAGDDTTIVDDHPDEQYMATGASYVVKKLTSDYITTDRALATMTAISATSKYPEKAMQLLELVNTDEEVYNTLCYGIEGKHYNKIEPYINDKGGKVTIEKIENSGYNPIRNWMFGNTANAWIYGNEAPASEWQNINNTAEISPILGFSFDSDPVANELSMCSNVITEYLTSLTSGSVDPTGRYDEFINKLKVAGCDKIVSEKQKQLDAWLSNK